MDDQPVNVNDEGSSSPAEDAVTASTDAVESADTSVPVSEPAVDASVSEGAVSDVDQAVVAEVAAAEAEVTAIEPEPSDLPGSTLPESTPDVQREHDTPPLRPESSSEDATAAADPATPAPDDATPVEEPVFKYQPGDIVPGTITAVGANGIEADLGDGALAVIPRAEIDGDDPEVGAAIEGSVIRHQAGTGRYVISPKRASRARAWTRIVAAFESGEPITGRVKEATKGGLIVDLGMRAFLPESLVDVRKGNSRALIGTDVTVKVIECEKLSGEVAAAERRSEKIVVNRRVVVEVERRAAKAQLMADLNVGDRRTGRVSALTDFGAFVDLGGVEGLVHVTELAHRQVAKASDVVKVGDQIDVVILEVRPDKGKISLSRKAALANPWTQFQAVHKAGDLVFGTVSGLAAFGAFVTIEGEGFEPLEGLVHISELSRFRVETPADVVAVGEGVWTQILAIEPDKRRVSLSLRRALE